MQPEMDTKTSRAKKSYIVRFVDSGVIMEAAKKTRQTAIKAGGLRVSKTGNGSGGGGGASDTLEMQKKSTAQTQS